MCLAWGCKHQCSQLQWKQATYNQEGIDMPLKNKPQCLGNN